MSDRVVHGRAEAAALFATPFDPLARETERARALRRSGVIRALVAVAFATLLYVLGRPVVASVAGAIGTITLVLALVSPTVGYAALSRAVDRVGAWTGTLLAWVLLAPVFFLFFFPFRVLFRRGARDTMHRGFDRSAKSYWSQHGPARDLEKPY